MALTKEQAEQIKEQLLKQLVNFPEDKREEMKEQVLAMSEEELEEFLKQNQLAQQGRTPSTNSPNQEQQCIFCSIVDGKVSSYKIDENKDNIAILEINPVSNGHTLVIPKQHLETEKIPSNAFTLAKKIAKKIKSKLKPKEVQISAKSMFGHSVVEILPLYGNESGERKKADEKDLEKLQKQLKAKPRKKPAIKLDSKGQPIKRKKKDAASKLPKLKPRMP